MLISKKAFLSVALTVSCLFGVSVNGQPSKFTEQVGTVTQAKGDEYKKAAALPADISRITFYRISKTHETGVVGIEIDGTYHTSLQPGSYSELCLHPTQAAIVGVRLIESGKPVKDLIEQKQSLKLEAGRDTFVRVFQTNSQEATLDVVPQHQALNELTTTHLRQLHAVSRVPNKLACNNLSESVITLNADVYFAFNRANQKGIVPDGLAALDRVIEQLQNEYVGRKAIRIEIVGFADPIGNATINQHLSLVRAQTIRKYLVAQGLSNVVMTVDGTASLDGLTWTNVTGTALTANSTYAQLVVDGTSADSVTIKTDTGTWTNAGTVSNGTSNYIVWQNTTAKTQILVQSAVNVMANVAPIILDLNGDRILSYSQVQMDVLSNGQLQQTAWVDAKDGVLVWDKFADGNVYDNSQYVFSQYSAMENATDLQGLAESFDTNHDGVFDTTDAKFAEFAVWQDHNQNGLTDMGEVQTLNSKGIASIQLNSDGVVRTPAVNVVEAGHTTALLDDGSVMVVSDAEFSVQMLAYHIDTVAPDYTKLTLTGAAIDLDLSTFATKHGAIAEVDLSGAGANSIRLNLADLLQDTPHASLKITGDTDDSAHVDLSDWSHSGRTVTEGGHTYAVYNDVTMHSAQLWIDQAMLNAHHVS